METLATIYLLVSISDDKRPQQSNLYTRKLREFLLISFKDMCLKVMLLVNNDVAQLAAPNQPVKDEIIQDIYYYYINI